MKQPYADAIVSRGESVKDVENRSQAWKYRGPLAIHAGQQYSIAGYDEVLSITGIQPRLSWTSGVIGVVDLVDVHREVDGCCGPWGHPGAVHLVLANPRRFPGTLTCRGALGLWTPPNWVTAMLTDVCGAEAVTE